MSTPGYLREYTRSQSDLSNDNRDFSNIPIRITNRLQPIKNSPVRKCNLENLVKIAKRETIVFESPGPFFENGLKLFHLNIRSLRNTAHLLQLREFALSNGIDVLTISETWLNSTVSNSEININDYKLQRLDRLHKKGGGVCAYIRKEIKAVVLKEITEISETNFHQLWIKLQYKKSKSVLICVSYRPPDCPSTCFENSFKANYIQALTLGKPIVVLGDLNCDMLKDGVDQKKLVDVCTELNLSQVIISPTRITRNSQSLIDVILVSSPTLVLTSGVLNIPISDHLPIYAVLNLKSSKPKPSYIKVRSYKNYQPSAFIADLTANSERLLASSQDKDVNAKLSIFNDVFYTTLNIHAPIKSIKVRSRPCPYVTKEIKELMKLRNRLHRCFLQTRNVYDWNNYKQARKTVKTTLLNAERKHVSDEISKNKNNPSSLWKTINRCLPLKEIDRQVYSKDPKVVATEFNEFFSKVGSRAAEASARLKIENNIEPLRTFPITSPHCELFNFTPVSRAVVRRIISSMPSNKSPGPDKVSMRVIKDCLSVILDPLTDIINCSLTTSTFPDEWKLAEVIPLIKEGDHELAENNRPLSLLNVISKVCEKVALEQFGSYLNISGCLSPHQSGNKKHHSTESLNVLVTDAMLEAMDEKKLTALVLLDLSKAFDSINHSFLLHKLTCVGASPAALKWFSSYLSGRHQVVRIGSAVSTPLPITHGVPQGAILSPLLFCIYLNDLPLTNQVCNLDSYVDDTKVYLSFPINNVNQAIKNLEEDLYKVAMWFCENQLLINPDKTKFLLVGTRQLMQSLPTKITLNFLGKILEPVTSVRDLGVIIDSHLTYDAHISMVVSSCMAKLCQINRVRNSFDNSTLSLIISALVFSKLFYCSTVWCNTSDTNIKKLQKVQNFAARIVTRTRKFDHITPVLHQLKWLPIQQQLLYRDALMTYKSVYGLAPTYLCTKLSKRMETHDRFTRNRDSLNIPLYRSASGQRSFKYRAAKLWNDMDQLLKEIPNYFTFKRMLKRSFENSQFID